MTGAISCDACGQTWPENDLDEIHDYWGRVDPGGVVPIGQCPDPECGALCSPPYGYVYELEQKLAALTDVLSRLVDWAANMGGWEAPVWDEARALLGYADTADEEELEDAW